MSDDDEVLFDDAVVLFGAEEPYDLEAAVNSTIAAVSAIVMDGNVKSKAEACARTQEVLLIAAVALAHANGLDEEQFGDLIVHSWDRYEADAGELN